MKPGPPAVCDGEVFHRRHIPAVHEFAQSVAYVWLDPDAPNDLCRHPLWSSTHIAPARFRSADYGDGSATSLATQVRDDLFAATGKRPSGSVRMLTQVRRWGWLFNPITIYLAWDGDDQGPVGAVLEVTNTPWKERHRYAVALDATTASAGSARFTARVPKVLHVSPFLDERYDYAITLASVDATGTGDIEFSIDVVTEGTDDVIVTTKLCVNRRPATRRALGASLRHNVAPTHRVSAGIHRQAVGLWAKRVPFVPHPRKRKVDS
jgi:uncharacterized protein